MSRVLFHGEGKPKSPPRRAGPPRYKTTHAEHSYMILSTGHVSEDTAKWLNEMGLEVAEKGQFGATGFAKEFVCCTPYGWLLWVPDDPANDPEYAHWAQDLKVVAEYARNNGYDYLMFDCDGPTVEELPTHKW